MKQTEREQYLIKSLLEERGLNAIPSGAPEGKNLLRALFNLRMPKPVRAEFLHVQDEYLQEELRAKGITDAEVLAALYDAR